MVATQYPRTSQGLLHIPNFDFKECHLVDGAFDARKGLFNIAFLTRIEELRSDDEIPQNLIAVLKAMLLGCTTCWALSKSFEIILIVHLYCYKVL
jgi:hypothetical protein